MRTDRKHILLSAATQLPPEAVAQIDATFPREVVLAKDAEGKPTVTVPIFYFKKDVLHTGYYIHPVHKWEENWTPEKFDAYVNTFNQMQADGVKVPFTVDHSGDVEDGRGQVVKLIREGETLYMIVGIVGQDAALAAARVPEVSVEIDEANNGQGKSYGDAIVAVSNVQYPLVRDQGPFVPIAASKYKGRKVAGKISTPTNARRAASKGTKAMTLKPEDKKALQKLLLDSGKGVDEIAGLDDDVLVETALPLLLKSTAPADPNDPNSPAALKKANTDQATTITTLSKRVKELEGGDANKELSDDLAHERTQRVRTVIESAVSDQRLDKETGAKALAKFTKIGDNPNKRMLSKVVGDGDIEAIEILNIFLGNKPAPVGEQSGRQRIEAGKGAGGGGTGTETPEAKQARLQKESGEYAKSLNRKK